MLKFIKKIEHKDTFNSFYNFLLACVPNYKDFSLFVIVSSFFGFVFLFGYLFMYFNSVTYASSGGAKVVDSVPDSLFDYLTFQVAGCVGLLNFATVDTAEFSPLTQSTGIGRSSYNRCASSVQASKAQTSANSSSFVLMDFGATGRVINATASLYAEPIAQPGETIDYYASRIRGEVLAQDNPVSGRSVLAPVQILNNNMVNLAYGLIVILLLSSSFNLLIANLTGVDTKLTIIQLIINSVVTLVMVTAYYEISAVIYDITVNYANALVAGFLSPFVNSIVILERLSPGGDLSIISILNAYQFIGVGDGLMLVINSIAQSVLPLINQSAVSVSSAVGGGGLDGNWAGAVAGSFFSLISGTGSIFIAGVANSILGHSQLFATVIAWVIFLLNIKIFFNLIMAYVTFTMLVGFGPLIALGGIEGGFDAIKESFKSLMANGLVFPATFFFILMAGIMFNLFIPIGQRSGAERSEFLELCRFSSQDPTVNETIVRHWGSHVGGIVSERYDPADFRMRNTINQNIINVTPASIIEEGGVKYRDCRPSLFPVPWTFVPAPFGSIGQRDLQIATIDSFIRTVLGIVFIIMASRVPDILKQALGVKDLAGLGDVQKVFSEGFQKTLSVGSQGLVAGFATVGGGIALTAKTNQFLSGQRWYNSLKDRFKKTTAEDVGSAFQKILNKYVGLDQVTKETLARQELMSTLNSGKAFINQGQLITQELNALGKAATALGNAFTNLVSQLEGISSRLASIATQLDIFNR